MTFPPAVPPRPSAYDADVDEMCAMGLAVLSNARERLTRRLAGDPAIAAALGELDAYAAELATGDEDTDSDFTNEDEASGPSTATVTVYGTQLGQPENLLRRWQIALDVDTDEEAQRIADAIAAEEPLAAGVSLRVLVGRDNEPHTYRTAHRAAPADTPDQREDAQWAT